MIKSNFIKIGDNCNALDFSVEGGKGKIISEYLIILYSLLSNEILDEKSIEMLNSIVKLAIKETNNDFEKFVKGVSDSYQYSKKEGYKNDKS